MSYINNAPALPFSQEASDCLNTLLPPPTPPLHPTPPEPIHPKGCPFSPPYPPLNLFSASCPSSTFPPIQRASNCPPSTPTASPPTLPWGLPTLETTPSAPPTVA